MSLYIETVINAPIYNFVSLIAEVDLFKEWVPMMSKSEIIGEYSPFRKLA